MPATNASVVMRIGPEPLAAREDDRLVALHPALAELVRELDLEDRVLLDDAEEDEDAERREDVDALSEDEDREERERHRQGEGEEDRHRVQPALELRREDEVHEDEGEPEREEEVLRGAALLLRAPDEPVRVGRVELQRLRLLHEEVDRDLRRVAGVHVREDRDLPPPVQSADLGRADARPERRHVLERDGAEAVGGHVESLEARLVGPVLGARAQVDVVLLAAVVERGDLLAADEDAERLGHVRDGDAEVRSLRARDRDAELGLAEDERRVDVHDAGHGPELRHERVRDLRELVQVRPVDDVHDLGVLLAAREGVHVGDVRAELPVRVVREDFLADAVHDRPSAGCLRLSASTSLT